MRLSANRAIRILMGLEDKFIKAGELALDKQEFSHSGYKSSTGVAEIDIITDADSEVQEFILGFMAKTRLLDCRLVAEEITDHGKNFNPNGNLYLTIDPIDGTSRYANRKSFWAVEVGLHDGQNMLYTFCHFPALDWTHRMIRQRYYTKGEIPRIPDLPEYVGKAIIYWQGNPSATAPEHYQNLIRQGYMVLNRHEVTEECGSTALVLAKKVAGYYVENPYAHDGLTILHYAQTQNFKIITGGPENKLDLSKIEQDQHPGWYLAYTSKRELKELEKD